MIKEKGIFPFSFVFYQICIMESENVIFEFKGYFNYQTVNKLLKDFYDYTLKESIDIYYYKKIQIIMVEVLENNYRYVKELSREGLDDRFLPEFKISQIGNDFKLLSSNVVLKNDARLLKTHIDEINNSNIDQLQELYKKILEEGIYTQKSSAGIGLIRIVKVTKNKIEYSFKKIDNKLLYYTLEIMINSK